MLPIIPRASSLLFGCFSLLAKSQDSGLIKLVKLPTHLRIYPFHYSEHLFFFFSLHFFFFFGRKLISFNTKNQPNTTTQEATKRLNSCPNQTQVLGKYHILAKLWTTPLRDASFQFLLFSNAVN